MMSARVSIESDPIDLPLTSFWARAKTDISGYGFMKTLQLTGWEKGIQTVSLVEAIKTYSTGSLVKAKSLVEELLAGKAISLTFDSEEEKEQFRVLAKSLGAKTHEV